MGARQSYETRRALALVDAGECNAYQAAKRCNIALSTIYRALARRKARGDLPTIPVFTEKVLP